MATDRAWFLVSLSDARHTMDERHMMNVRHMMRHMMDANTEAHINRRSGTQNVGTHH